MKRIDEEAVREVRERCDIVEVISGYLQLKRSGANYLGLCPFHQEKTPSFNVNAPRQIFHCFGCGAGGNVITFVMRMEGLSFPEAVKRLGEKVGVVIEETPLSSTDLQQRNLREKIFQVNESACDFYHALLLEDTAGAAGRRYLRQRGYEADLVKQFRLGIAPDQWECLLGHLKGKGFKDAEMHAAGLVRAGRDSRRDHDLFHNRLLFPILDAEGRVVAFGGRVLDNSTPKYLNSPESLVYHKGRVLYGLYQGREAIRQSRTVLVVEGYFDLLALHRAGIANAVAACGTALTSDHARLIKRFADRVFLVFDADKAGRQATFRAMDALLPEGLAVNAVSLATGEDPDSFLASSGPDAFRSCLDKARPVLELFLDDQLQLHGESIGGRARVAEELLERIRRLPSDLERNLYIKQLALRTGLDESLLQTKGQIAPVSRPAQVHSPQVKKSSPGSDERTQAFLLRLMLVSDQVRRQVDKEGVDALFASSTHRKVASHLLAVEDSDGRLPDQFMDNSLDETAQSLLSGLILADGQEAWATDPERIFADCRKAVISGAGRMRIVELQSLIRTAEREGNSQAVENYISELVKIKKSL